MCWKTFLHSPTAPPPILYARGVIIPKRLWLFILQKGVDYRMRRSRYIQSYAFYGQVDAGASQKSLKNA